jgi:hypothetical protein
MKTRSQIQTEINSKVVSNNNREITGDILNNILNDINDSSINKLSDGSTFGLFEYDVIQTYQMGQCAVYQNQLWKATSLVEGGSFDITKWSLQSPVKIWKAKLTGVSGDIPTIEIIKDDLFGASQPFLTYASTGLIRFEYNQDVFKDVFSVSFDNSRSSSSNIIAHAISNIINTTTNDVYFFDKEFEATDEIETYYTLSVYN